MTESGATEATPVVGRFAPSPTGRDARGQHLRRAHRMARGEVPGRPHGAAHRGSRTRERSKAALHRCRSSATSRPLGLTWDEGPYFQHDRDEAYRRGLRRALRPRGSCTRASARGPTCTRRRPPTGARSSVYAGHLPPPVGRGARHGAPAAGRTPALESLPCPVATIAFARPGAGILRAEPRRATAATSSYAAPTARSPTSWQWWWTMPPRA